MKKLKKNKIIFIVAVLLIIITTTTAILFYIIKHSKTSDMEKQPQDEQKELITVTPSPTATQEPVVTEPEPTTTTTQDTSTSTTTNSGTSKSNTSTSSTSKPNTSTSNTNTSNTSNSNSSTSVTTTPSTPVATGQFVYKPNYEVQNQVISRIQTIIDNSPSFQQWGGSINAGYGCQGQRFTFRGINNHDWYTENSDGSGHGLVLPGQTSYVYAEDEYCIMSDGTEVKTGMTYLSIWSTI